VTTLPSIQGEEVAQRPLRVLTAWLSEQEAMVHLLGRTPMPQEDLTAISQKILACKASLEARPVFVPKYPVIDVGDDPMLQAMKERPEIRAAFAGLTWYPAMVNLRDVIAFQKIISVEGLEARVASAHRNKEQLLELCLPTNQPLPLSAALVDPDGRGFTVSSHNPNLRITGGQGEAEVSPGPGLPTIRMQALMFFVTLGASFVQVAHYKGRYFIRDGYHRGAGLLHEGIDVAPCILIDAKNFDEVVMGQPQAFLPYEILFGERPPRLADFWDDDVAHTILRPAVRKIVRVRGDEFVVQG